MRKIKIQSILAAVAGLFLATSCSSSFLDTDPTDAVSSETGRSRNSASTRFLQNNSYMRLKNLTLSYNLPKQWISKLSLSSVQVYVQGDNLFTIHRNQGLDPEQGITGITYYRYPAMRTISGGINVSF